MTHVNRRPRGPRPPTAMFPTSTSHSAGGQQDEGIIKMKIKAAARESAAALAAAAGAWADQDFRPQDELLEACAAGGLLLVLRAPYRSATLFSEELRAAARLASLPEHLLVPLGAGLWLLRGETDSLEAAQLLSRLPQLCGVRLLLEICCCAVDSASLLSSLRASPPARHHAPHWGLRYEQHFPASVMALAPWSHVATAPAVSIGLAVHFGPAFVSVAAGTAPAGGLDDLVLLETKPVLFLCRNRPILRHRPQWLLPGVPRPPPPTGQPAPPSPWPAAPTGEALPSESGTVASAAPCGPAPNLEGAEGLPWWICLWDVRPFAFSASLEPLVASAAVSIATSIHLASHPRASAGQPLHMLDPCCGSGTVLVAGLAQGHRCRGSDLREDFVTRARDNLAYMHLSLDGIAQHDALQPFPPGVGPPPDLIVSNPPWGKHIGAEDDGARIIASVVRQFGGSTMCWLANATALATALGIAGVELVYHCRLGGVEAFVLRTRCA